MGRSLRKGQIPVITLGERAEQALRVVREAPIMAYDTETSGLDWKIHHPVGYVITTKDFNIYVPIRHGGGGNLLDPNCGPLVTATDTNVQTHSFEYALQSAFQERRQRGYLTIGHHLKFDMHMSANRGIMVGRDCEDTGVNAAMLDEYSRSFSLDNLAREAGVTLKLGDKLYQRMAQVLGGKADRDIMEHFWKMPGNDEEVVDYATGDGTSTLELREWQRPKIAEQGMDAVHSVESQLIWTIFRMERRGIKVDLTRMEEVKAGVAKLVAEYSSVLPAGFNVNSGPQAIKVLQEAGFTQFNRTPPSTKFPDGQLSCNEKVLKRSPKGRDILALRKWTNFTGKFLKPLEENHTHNGRVYSSLNQMKGDEFGTISGRFSCSDPNLQAIPKRDKEIGRLFRSLFVPDEGMDFWEGDYSQCEPRLFAHYSREPALLEGYSRNPPLDMHHVVAQAFSVERDPTAKRMNMGILTGMQVDSFAGHMDWPRDKAQEMFDKWWELFPGIKDFQDHCKNVFRQTWYIRTLLGRRCHLDHARFAYRGTSRVIQGGNADIVKYKLLQVDKWLEGTYDQFVNLLMTVHDSYEWQAVKGEQGTKLSMQMVEMFCDVQSEPFNLRIPFIMDVGHGPSWAIATYGEPKPGSGA